MGELDFALAFAYTAVVVHDVYQKLAQDMSYRPFDHSVEPVGLNDQRPDCQPHFNPQLYYDNKMRMRRC